MGESSLWAEALDTHKALNPECLHSLEHWALVPLLPLWNVLGTLRGGFQVGGARPAGAGF